MAVDKWSSLDRDLVLEAKNDEEMARHVNSFYAPLTGEWPIEVKYIDKHVGKGVFATRDIKEGDKVFEDSPMAVLDESDDNICACAECMAFLHYETAEGELLGPFPRPTECSGGCGRTYCGTECEVKAWQTYHSILCEGSEASRNPHLEQFYTDAYACSDYIIGAAEIVARVLLTWEKNGHDLKAAYLPYSFIRKTPWWLLKWGAGEDLQTPTASCIGHLLNGLGDRFPIHSEPLSTLFDLNFFGALVGMLELNVLGLDLWSPTTDCEDREWGKSTSGIGMYQVHCCTNHSCVPNTRNIESDNRRSSRIHVFALRDIKAGEQITNSYHRGLLKSYSARTFKLSHYEFECQCPKCLTKESLD